MSDTQTTTGFLDTFVGGSGRLRQLEDLGSFSADDPVVKPDLIERLELRPGVAMEVTLGQRVNPNGNGQQQQQQQRRGRGKKGKNRRGGKPKGKARFNPIGPQARAVAEVTTIEGLEPQKYLESLDHRKFEDLTSIDPQPRLDLEFPGCSPANRLIDLFCPIGYGQRAMIVSPPKAGKTTLLKNIAEGIAKNHPDVELIALLVDERPEEVTDFRRNVPAMVLASSNDHPPERHVMLSVLAIDRAKRMAEAGKDVVVLMDSLTRVGRAFNTCPGLVQTGRIMTGGLDSGALAIPKQLFGAARKFEEGGSLSIIASCLIDTGSKGDQIIFEEFKGTGNCEIILDRKISEQRVFPAINLAASGTRKEHLMMGEKELDTVNALRRRLLNMNPVQQIEQLLKALERFKTNADLVGNPQSPGNT